MHHTLYRLRTLLYAVYVSKGFGSHSLHPLGFRHVYTSAWARFRTQNILFLLIMFVGSALRLPRQFSSVRCFFSARVRLVIYILFFFFSVPFNFCMTLFHSICMYMYVRTRFSGPCRCVRVSVCHVDPHPTRAARYWCSCVCVGLCLCTYEARSLFLEVPFS